MLIRSSDVVRLWQRSGEQLMLAQEECTSANIQDYELTMERLEVLCRARHNQSINYTIQYYIDQGWIEQG